MIAHSATARRTHPATKWRNDVAMGVSPWMRNPSHPVSPEGTAGNPTQPTHVCVRGIANSIAITCIPGMPSSGFHSYVHRFDMRKSLSQMASHHNGKNSCPFV